ncbi:helix-turn-helix domain-containing protein [Lactiplantibacillus plantarum]|uniref:helix-turn-helix domain-containing protein n=1 Tax=Lactiplantibacillus plantarum TaxID=1590 RepID=UPI00097685F5|nr:helix-turn-helix domain-containing protein [Lactiplantibacillus plantarum]MCC6117618.1 helix-turn-helix domain-containing protein [Lactiplantibacillus plantarum]MCW6115165.1 helix-turn-helix domain-containing protein [Lactiplantibacillus plantarum]TLQ24756.1 helix-turn-helix domain-containing protein [Lactiplantibacillus plantarum]
MSKAEIQWLTYQQVMEELHIGSVNTVYKMINDGLKVTSIGRLKRIERKELEKYLNSKTF